LSINSLHWKAFWSFSCGINWHF